MSDKEKLRQWLDEHDYTVASFQRRMGYNSYAHAWEVLHGDGSLSDSVIGRLARCLPDALLAIRDELRPCDGDAGDTTNNIPQDSNSGALSLATGAAQ